VATLTVKDEESAALLSSLRGEPAEREAGYARLHARLVRVAHGELRRRSALRFDGPERDDLAHQAAADALVSIRRRLPEFRGESRFTTWAFKFVILEVSRQAGRHFWTTAPPAAIEAEQWERLPDRFELDPACASERRELFAELRQAVNATLSERQRRVFVAIVLNGIPLDSLVHELDSSRNAIYKTLYDARCKLRAHLVASGHLEDHDAT
jgi:RNA polymerase sigma-70 factor, ECF subfamily